MRNLGHPPNDNVTLRLGTMKIQQGDVRALLLSLENNFMAVCGNVKVANIEVGRQVGQLALGACLEVDEPEILMLNLASQNHESPSPR